MPNYTSKVPKKIYPVNPQQSLKENIAAVLPLMYDDFISLAGSVLSSPNPKNLIHRMRINGKPLRYAMEIAEDGFGKEFKNCFNEVKKMLELMGSIHDCDVNISELEIFLKEIRTDNNKDNVEEKISTTEIEGFINMLKGKRKELFGNFSDEINKWRKENFKERLIKSMNN